MRKVAGVAEEGLGNYETAGVNKWKLSEPATDTDLRPHSLPKVCNAGPWHKPFNAKGLYFGMCGTAREEFEVLVLPSAMHTLSVTDTFLRQLIFLVNRTCMSL